MTCPPRHRFRSAKRKFLSARALLGEGAPRAVQAGFCCRRGELSRQNENPAAQRLAQGLDSRYLVDRRSDDREVEAIHRANIAIEHLAEVKREVDHGSRLSHPCSIRVKSVEAAHCFGGGGERVAAGFIACSSHEGKARKHVIAKELQHLPCGRSAAVNVSNMSSSIREGQGGGRKPRISAYQRTARMLSTEPRSTTPA